MKKIAVLIPCYNEALTIESVVKRYKEALPSADIYVYDNNSKDGSDKLAEKAGAIVRYEKNQGKGFVVRSMFKDIDADCYFMVDADDTYMADNAQQMCDMVLSGEFDMVIGDRLNSTYMTEEKRKSHTFGNKLVRFLINKLYKNKITDIMTGQRAFSKRFVKSFPCNSNGFEIETEMTIFACDNGMTVKEVPVVYKDRPEGSFSKLNTYRDGFKVLKTILKMFVKEHSMKFFGWMSIPFALLGVGFAVPVICQLAKAKAVSCAFKWLAISGFAVASLLNIIGAVVSKINSKKKLKNGK
ncbi:MAG: glycosyltransferase [Clostridia bacterium]|nr:glycosyltransferase [Clostridia bacterium]